MKDVLGKLLEALGQVAEQIGEALGASSRRPVPVPVRSENRPQKSPKFR